MPTLVIEEEMWRQFTTQLQQIYSAVSTTAVGKRELTPRGQYVTGPASVTIPSGTKAFNIINLGLDGANKVFENLAVTGIAGITEILAVVTVFGYTIENDLDVLHGDVVITPAVDHIVLIQYLTSTQWP